MLEETKRLLMEDDIITNSALDCDDDRLDFVDAEYEEITDRISRKFYKK